MGVGGETDEMLCVDGATVRFDVGSAAPAWLRRVMGGVSGDEAGSRIAIRDVGLRLGRGQRVALVGPSGCGKTTLLRVIAGLQPLTAGSVGHENGLAGGTAGKPVRRGDISFVFQQPALLPWRDVLGNVTLPLELGATGRQRERGSGARMAAAAEAVLNEVNLEDVTQHFPHQLSGGMQMRVSIARALVTEPRLLLLDEPFAALDDLLRHQLGSLVTDLWREHRFTMVLVTHNIAEAITLCDRICVMGNGRLSEELANPLDRATGADVRRTPEFAAFHGAVSDALAAAVMRDGDQSP